MCSLVENTLKAESNNLSHGGYPSGGTASALLGWRGSRGGLES
jgi:hypothetical protein